MHMLTTMIVSYIHEGKISNAQDMSQAESYSHSKNRGGKTINGNQSNMNHALTCSVTSHVFFFYSKTGHVYQKTFRIPSNLEILGVCSLFRNGNLKGQQISKSDSFLRLS